MGSSPEYKLTDWMAELPDTLKDTPLNELAIPGTHDSFSFALDCQSEIGPDDSEMVRGFLNSLGPFAKNIAHKWAVTQSQNFTEQLNSGIRYFDFRVSSRAGSDEIHFLHRLYAGKVKDSLTEIDTFLHQHPKEIVILDFNHFYEMSDTAHENFLNMLQDRWASKMCMFVGVENVTLNMLWENQLQLIVLYHHPLVSNWGQFWPGSSIKAFWANTDQVPRLMSSLQEVYNRGRPGDVFYSWQGVVTPNLTTIMANLEGSLKDTIGAKTTLAFTAWLRDKKRGPRGINICIADFTDVIDFASAVIALNYA